MFVQVPGKHKPSEKDQIYQKKTDGSNKISTDLDHEKSEQESASDLVYK